MGIFRMPGASDAMPGARSPRGLAALAAIAAYAVLVLAVRRSGGDFHPMPVLGSLDQSLYSRYLDLMAYLHGRVAANWAAAFVSTVATECFVLGMLLRKYDFLEVARAGFLASLATHPLFWYGLTGIRADYALWVVVLELAIAAVEALVLFAALRDISLPRCLILSAAANGASFLLGLLGGVG